MLNNIDKEQRVHEWYSVDIKKDKRTNFPYKREGLLYRIWERIRTLSPFTSTKGCCK